MGRFLRSIRSVTLSAALLSCVLIFCNPSEAAVGRTSGGFDVSASGSATYSIPIVVPAGPQGIQPNLAIVYNHRSGVGPMGPGWSLAGLSSITRCNKTFAQDSVPAPVALSYGDAFCLDGQRLRLTSSNNLGTYGQDGTTYQTEIAEFSKVIAYGVAGNGPAYFRVQRKNGLTYEYGNGSGSQVLATGTSTASAWLLNKITDRSQNSMVVTYLAPSSTLAGTSVPNTISWTRSSFGAATYNYTMQFNYTANVPQSSIIGYLGGTSVLNQNRLDSIAIKNSGTTIKQYSFTYGTSPTTARYKLTQIRECADSAGANCLAPTTIAYQDGQAGVSTSATTAVTGAVTLLKNHDLNGDGYFDLVYSNGSTIYVAFASAAGYGTPVNTAIASANLGRIGDLLGKGQDGLMANNSGIWWYYMWNGSSFTGSSTGVAATGTDVLADANGDGLPDIIHRQTTTEQFGSDVIRYSFHLLTRLNTSSGGTLQFSSTVADGVIWTCTNNCTVTLNFPDQAGAGPLPSWDFNGDGRHDLAMRVQFVQANQTVSNTFYELLSDGGNFIRTLVAGPQSGGAPVAYVVNWNNDACTDAQWGGLWISRCNGSTATSVAIPGNVLTVLDWNLDGRTDVLVPNGGTIGVYLSTGTGVSTLQSTSVPYSSTCEYFTTDANGDGLDDLGCRAMVAPNSITYYLHNSPGQPADLVSSITDGFGVNVSPIYVALTRGNHVKGTGAVYPEQDIQPSLYVVRQLNTSNGIGGTYTQTYSYAGARKNLRGYGFEGFQSMKVTDNRANSLVQVRSFRTEFPYTGMMSQDEVFQNNGTTLVSRTIFTNSKLDLNTAVNNQRRFVFVQTENAKAYEVGGVKNGQLIRTAVTTRSYDGYGNATNIATTITDNDAASPSFGAQWATTTVTTLAPDAGANWCLTQPTEIAVTSNAPNTSVLTRTIDFTPDYAKCRATQKIIEPFSATHKVTEDYGFDNFGNVSSVGVTGIGMTVRMTTTNWGTTGQFPVSVTNALSQATQTGWNYSFGLPSSQTDPNNITTSWLYDGFGRRTRENRADGTATTWTYSDCSTVSGGCTNGNNKMTISERSLDTASALLGERRTYTDRFDRTLSTSVLTLSGNYNRVDREYDAFGRLDRETAPCWWTSCARYWTTYSYDAVGRPTQISRPVADSDPTLQSSSFHYEGVATRALDAYSRQTTKIIDAIGQTIRVTDEGGYSQSFAYDAFGNVVQVADSSGNILQTATFNVRGMRTASTDADRGSWSYVPNALGEVVSQTDANSKTTTFAYDGLSRLTSKVVPEGAGSITNTFTWGSSATAKNIGKINWVQSAGAGMPSWKETYLYDSLGRASQIQFTEAGTTNYFIDRTYQPTTGFLDSLTYPTSTSSYRLKLKYEYQNGQLLRIKDFNASTTIFWQANATDPAGHVLDEQLGISATLVGGLRTIRGFDLVTGQIDSVQTGPGSGTSLQNLTYAFDQMGNLKQRRDLRQGLIEDFFYDSLYRLDYSNLNGVQNLDLTYNALGNITAKSDVGAYTYHPTKIHAVQTIGGGGANTYDAVGNTTVVPDLGTVSWYHSGLVKTLNTGAGWASTFYYGPDGNRFKHVSTYPTSTETTIYIGGLVEKVTDSGITDWRHYIVAPTGPVAVYIRKSSGSPAAMAYYLTKDHLGSVDAITDASGAIQVRLSYGAFGERRKEAGWVNADLPQADWDAIYAITHRGFTFHETIDDLGIINMNGRVFEPVAGRFASADPFIDGSDNTQGYNRYSYVGNNPLSYTDPTGYQTARMIQRPYDGGSVDTAGIIAEIVTTGHRERTPMSVPIYVGSRAPNAFSNTGNVERSTVRRISVPAARSAPVQVQVQAQENSIPCPTMGPTFAEDSAARRAYLQGGVSSLDVANVAIAAGGVASATAQSFRNASTIISGRVTYTGFDGVVRSYAADTAAQARALGAAYTSLNIAGRALATAGAVLAANDLTSSDSSRQFNGAYGLASALLGVLNPAAGASMALVGLAASADDGPTTSVFDRLPGTVVSSLSNSTTCSNPG